MTRTGTGLQVHPLCLVVVRVVVVVGRPVVTGGAFERGALHVHTVGGVRGLVG